MSGQDHVIDPSDAVGPKTVLPNTGTAASSSGTDAAAALSLAELEGKKREADEWLVVFNARTDIHVAKTRNSQTSVNGDSSDGSVNSTTTHSCVGDQSNLNKGKPESKRKGPNRQAKKEARCLRHKQETTPGYKWEKDTHAYRQTQMLVCHKDGSRVTLSPDESVQAMKEILENMRQLPDLL